MKRQTNPAPTNLPLLIVILLVCRQQDQSDRRNQIGSWNRLTFWSAGRWGQKRGAVNTFLPGWRIGSWLVRASHRFDFLKLRCVSTYLCLLLLPPLAIGVHCVVYRPRHTRIAVSASSQQQYTGSSMIPADQITHAFLVVGVAAAAVMPRQPSDHHGRCTVGGRLSNSFRRLLLFIVGLKVVRMVTLATTTTTPTNGVVSISTRFGDLLGVIEVTGLTFLCFLTAFVLQRGLAQFFHIVPGRDLQPPLFFAALLSLLGVTLSRSVHPNFWALKKLANAASGPVILKTLKSYNAYSNQASHGQGFIMGQTLWTIEYWHLVVQLCCALGYALNRGDVPESEQTSLDILLEAARNSAFLADWTRVLLHAVFLNQMDEMFITAEGWGDQPLLPDGSGSRDM
jgi:hypothetical protein